MKVSDLMIGDWVKVVDDDTNEIIIGKIKYIDGEHSNVNVIIFDDSVSYPFSIDCIQPIPLTPEILKKNGFVYSDIPFEQSWQQFGLSIWGTMGNYHISCGMNISMDVSNVHELQHAMKLCNIDKENVL